MRLMSLHLAAQAMSARPLRQEVKRFRFWLSPDTVMASELRKRGGRWVSLSPLGALGAQAIEQLDASIHRGCVRDIDAQAAGELHDRPRHARKLEPLADLQILQH